jgi:hypothetical protein
MVCSTAARSGMRLIKSCSFRTSLQFMCCQVLRRIIPSDQSVLEVIDLPPGMRAFLTNNLSWLLRPCELGHVDIGDSSSVIHSDSEDSVESDHLASVTTTTTTTVPRPLKRSASETDDGSGSSKDPPIKIPKTESNSKLLQHGKSQQPGGSREAAAKVETDKLFGEAAEETSKESLVVEMPDVASSPSTSFQSCDESSEAKLTECTEALSVPLLADQQSENVSGSVVQTEESYQVPDEQTSP